MYTYYVSSSLLKNAIFEYLFYFILCDKHLNKYLSLYNATNHAKFKINIKKFNPRLSFLQRRVFSVTLNIIQNQNCIAVVA